MFVIDNFFSTLFSNEKESSRLRIYNKYIGLVFASVINFPTHWLRKTKRLTSSTQISFPRQDFSSLKAGLH